MPEQQRKLPAVSRPARAAEACELALGEFQVLADADPEDGGSRSWLTRTRSNLGLVRERLGRCAEAIREHGQSVDLARAHVTRAREARQEASTPNREAWLLFDLDHRESLGVALTNLGELLVRLSRLSEAEVAFRESVALYEGLADAVPSYQEYPWSLAMARNNLGWTLSESSPARWAEAEALIRQAGSWYDAEMPRLRSKGETDELLSLYSGINRFRAGSLAIRRARVGQGSPDPAAATRSACEHFREGGNGPEPRQWLAEALDQLGDSQELAGEPEEAIESWGRARSSLDALAGEWRLVPGIDLLLAEVEAKLSNRLGQRGRPEDARRFRELARRRLESARSEGSDDPILLRIETEPARLARRPDDIYEK